MVGDTSQKIYGFTELKRKMLGSERAYKFSQNKAKDTSIYFHSSNT